VEGVQEVDREFEYASVAGAAAWPCFLALGSTSGGGSGDQASRSRAPLRPNVPGSPLTSLNGGGGGASHVQLSVPSFSCCSNYTVLRILFVYSLCV
jgi:hypothetical protein